MSELFLSIGAVYYHSLQGVNASNEDISIWIASGFMAPLLAVIGSQMVRVALAGRLAARKKAWEESPAGRQWAADVMAEANANMGAVDGDADDDEVFEDVKGEVIDEKPNTYADDDLFEPEEDVEETFFKDKDYN